MPNKVKQNRLSFRQWLAVRAGRFGDRLEGRDSREALHQAELMQWWGESQYREYQDQKLRDLVLHAIRFSPFYRRKYAEAGLDEQQVATVPDLLQSLPPLSKDEVREHAADLCTRPTSQMRVSKTSGSTGRPVQVWSAQETSSWARAVQRRAFNWYGVDPYEPRAMLLSAPVSGWKRIRHKAIDLAIGRRLYTFYDLGRQNLLDVAHRIRRFRPSFVTAYPSVLHDLCEMCHQHKVDLSACGVRLLHTQSEMLQEFHRNSYRRVFGDIPVLNEYGCVEIGAMAYACPEGTLHISHEHVMLEVVDDAFQPAPSGSIGRILLTGLNTQGMPFIRYDVGDEGVISRTPCACGRMHGTAVLERLSGRVFDRIHTLDGREYSSGLMHFLVRRSDINGSLREYLAVQRRAGALHLYLIPAHGIDSQLIDRLTRECCGVFGPDMQLTAEYVDVIPAEKRRKRSYFVSEIEG